LVLFERFLVYAGDEVHRRGAYTKTKRTRNVNRRTQRRIRMGRGTVLVYSRNSSFARVTVDEISVLRGAVHGHSTRNREYRVARSHPRSPSLPLRPSVQILFGPSVQQLPVDQRTATVKK
jgi:hypothetical protein